jgi:hypothetical protein
MNYLIVDDRSGEILFETMDEKESLRFLDDLKEESIIKFNNASIHKIETVRRSIIKGS